MMDFAATEELARSGHLYPSVILHGQTAEVRQTAALRLAQTLLCEAEGSERPCGSCKHCSRIVWPSAKDDSFHPDFQVLERDLKTSTSVSATKAFLQGAQVTPFEARGQVFVLASAESLTGEAANALLKTLEEPHVSAPRNFLLLSPSQFDLLATVRSRSLAVYLGVSEADFSDEMESLADEFAASIRRFMSSGSALHLLAGAETLARVSAWKDPRDASPWSQAAAIVRRSCDLVESGSRRGLLSLAEELLGGWQSRVRGIQAQRVLEGMVVNALSSLAARGDGRGLRVVPPVKGR
jgi:DNA polymerase-3 subunit delta'